MTEVGFAFLRHVKPLHGISVEFPSWKLELALSRLMAARIARVSRLLKSICEESGFLDE